MSCNKKTHKRNNFGVKSRNFFIYQNNAFLGRGDKNECKQNANLFEFPSVGHCGDHLSNFVLVTLNYSVNVFFGISLWPSVPQHDSLIDETNEFSYIIEFSFFEDTLFRKVFINNELSMTQVIEYGAEVFGVSIYEISPCVVLRMFHSYRQSNGH